MSSLSNGARAPGSFSAVVAPLNVTKRPPLRHVESSDSEDPQVHLASSSSTTTTSRSRNESQNSASSATVNAPPSHAPPRPFYAQAHANSSTGSLQNFSRPATAQRDPSYRGPDTVLSTAGGTAAAGVVGVSANAAPVGPAADSGSSWYKSHSRKHSSAHDITPDKHGRNASHESAAVASGHVVAHGRKHSQTQGFFDTFLPSTAHGSLATTSATPTMSASQIAAQAAMQQLQQQQQQQQQQQNQSHHARRRSQTVPSQHIDTSASLISSRRPSRGPPTPVLSLTEASVPRGNSALDVSTYQGMLGAHANAAQSAASAVYPRPPVAHAYDDKALPEKPSKSEKAKSKLFSRPGKISIGKDKDKDPKTNTLPSPNKLGQYTLASLGKMNMSTTSVADASSGAASLYSLANSSTATIRADPGTDKDKDKEKHKHHFLSRQKHKLDHHLALSSAASNSRPVDPSAPSSLYNFNLPPSPGPSSTSFSKSMSGLDLRHGGRALREKKKEEKESMREFEGSFRDGSEWPIMAGGTTGAQAMTANGGFATGIFGDALDLAKFGLNNMGPDDAWPYLKAKLLIIFEGEDLRLPVEDLNRLVSTHMQRCIQKRIPATILEDVLDLLHTGFTSFDATLHRIPDEKLIPSLVEMWLLTFTVILPYLQAVFLPLDLELAGHGSLLSHSQVKDLLLSRDASDDDEPPDTRQMILISFRDIIILSRFELLKATFSRLSLDALALPMPSPLPNAADNLSYSDSQSRPGTAMSLDPSLASFSSNTSTLINAAASVSSGGSGTNTSAFPPFAPGGSREGNRSRAISNTSTKSDGQRSMPPPPPPLRPFTPGSTHPATPASFSSAFAMRTGAGAGNVPDRLRERSVLVEDGSNKLTETVGRMLQCMSVLASLGGPSPSKETDKSTSQKDGGAGKEGDGADEQSKMEELNRTLKLNWLGRGRMGRNRRGLVGARVPGHGATATTTSNRSVEVGS